MSINSLIKKTVMATLTAITVTFIIQILPASALLCNNERCIDCFPNSYTNCVICCKNHRRGDTCIARCEAAKK